MEQIIGHITGIIAPIFLCVLAGVALARLDLPFDKKSIGTLVSTVGYPTLILSHLAQQHIALSGFLTMLAAAILAISAFAVISSGILLVFRLPVRSYLSPMMLNNVGNVGLPVCSLAFGSQGMAYAMAFVVVVLVLTFTVGMWLPMRKVTFGDLFRKPVIYAVIVSLLLMGTDTKLPETLNHTFTILGGLTIPLMLLTLGHTLATLQVGTVVRSTFLAVLHLCMGAVVGAIVVALFGFQGVERGVVILLCLMPVSVSAYLWVQLYDPDNAEGVAALILVSSILTVLALPPVLAFWI